MTRFYLIRHGEKDSPAELLSSRTAGIHLTDLGVRQAEAIARRLEGESLQRICASPMERAQETARPLAQAKNLPIETLAGLNECEFGDWTNRRVDELKATPTWEWFNTFRSGTRTPGGEWMLEIQARFVGEMLRLRDRHPDASLALFSHGDPIRSALMYFSGTPLDFWQRFEISIGSITVIELSDDGVKITRVNEVPELPAK